MWVQGGSIQSLCHFQVCPSFYSLLRTFVLPTHMCWASQLGQACITGLGFLQYLLHIYTVKRDTCLLQQWLHLRLVEPWARSTQPPLWLSLYRQHCWMWAFPTTPDRVSPCTRQRQAAGPGKSCHLSWGKGVSGPCPERYRLPVFLPEKWSRFSSINTSQIIACYCSFPDCWNDYFGQFWPPL